MLQIMYNWKKVILWYKHWISFILDADYRLVWLQLHTNNFGGRKLKICHIPLFYIIYVSFKWSRIQECPSSWMLRLVALVRTDVSEKPSASIIRVTQIVELATTLAVTSNRRTQRGNTKLFPRSVRRLLVTAKVGPNSTILVTLMMDALGSSETSVLTRATERNIPGEGHSW
jgi:hypothetical protein